MNPRALAALSLVLAGGLYLAVTIPATEQTASFRLEEQRLRRARGQARTRSAAVERRAGARRRAEAIIAQVPALGGEDPLARLRTDILDILAGRPVSGVRLRVQPHQAPAEAAFRLEAGGPLRPVVALSGELALPSQGLMLTRVIFRPDSRGVGLEIEGKRVRKLP